MKFDIEKCVMLIMKSRRLRMTEGIELPKQEKRRMLREKELRK